jgi:hypothetical protein
MAVLVDKNTRVVTQGLGATGQLHTRLCKEYGSQMVAGVAPGKGGTEFEGMPIFDTVSAAVNATRRATLRRRGECRLHPLNRPEQVDRRRARRGHQIAGALELRGELFGARRRAAPHPQRNSHRRRHTNRRRAADHHRGDRLGDVLGRPAGDVDLGPRQLALVDHHDAGVVPLDGRKHSDDDIGSFGSFGSFESFGSFGSFGSFDGHQVRYNWNAGPRAPPEHAALLRRAGGRIRRGLHQRHGHVVDRESRGFSVPKPSRWPASSERSRADV